jgi:hypothetical protein
MTAVEMRLFAHHEMFGRLEAANMMMGTPLDFHRFSTAAN